MEKKNSNHKIDGSDIAKGVAVATVAAGVVTAGVLLSNKKNRKKAGKMAAKGIKMAREIAQEIGDEANSKYQAVQMTVPLKKTSTFKKSSKSRGRKS